MEHAMRTGHKWFYLDRYRLLKFLSLVLCFGLFVLLTVDVMDKYFKGMTNIGTVSEGSDQGAKYLPCLTLCPWQAFRRRKFSYKTMDFLAETFNQSEILVTSSTAPFDSSADFYITELRSVYLGRCYMVCFKSPYQAAVKVYVWVKKNISLIAHLHSRSSSVWINIGTSLISLNSISITESLQMASIELSLTERQTKALSKDQHRCGNYHAFEDYDECVKAFFVGEMGTVLNCSLPGMEAISENLTECTENESAAESFRIFSMYTYGNKSSTWRDECPVPCIQKTYAYSMKKYHINSWLNPDKSYPDELINDSTAIILNYKTLTVENEVEAYMYDIGSFLASVGGNLGLLLGFSCFTVILALINFIKKCSNKRFFRGTNRKVVV